LPFKEATSLPFKEAIQKDKFSVDLNEFAIQRSHTKKTVLVQIWTSLPFKEAIQKRQF